MNTTSHQIHLFNSFFSKNNDRDRKPFFGTPDLPPPGCTSARVLSLIEDRASARIVQRVRQSCPCSFLSSPLLCTFIVLIPSVSPVTTLHFADKTLFYYRLFLRFLRLYSPPDQSFLHHNGSPVSHASPRSWFND